MYTGPSAMLVSLRAGPYSIRGVSVGGVYTSLHIAELGAVFDVGLAPRSFAGVKRLFLSHAHVDHVGALASMLGIRGLMGLDRKLQVFMPAEIVEPLAHVLAHQTTLQRYDLSVDAVAMNDGDEVQLRNDLWVRAFKTFHPVPSLGYLFVRKVQKLRPEFADLPGPEIGARRKAGDDLFADAEVPALAYATDTLATVLDHNPVLYRTGTLILECTFLDQRKSIEAARAGCHIHLDEIIERADRFENDHLVLMHLSQIYKPSEVRPILEARLPPSLYRRVHVLAPSSGPWPG